MMLEVKKQYQPSLDPISQILEEEQLAITKPIIRDGSIRREVGFISSWKQRIFAILYVPQQKLTISVYTKDSSQPQQIINIAEARLSKKCSQIDNKFCFGLVTEDNQKYLISLKSSRECLKYYYQIVSAKKMLKQNMRRGSNSRNPLYRSVQKSPSGKAESAREFQIETEPVEAKTENHSVESQQEEHVIWKMSEYLGRGDDYKPSPTYSAKSLPFNKKEPIVIKPEVKEIQKLLHAAKIEDKVDSFDKGAYLKLENFEGYNVIEEFAHGTIYQKKNHIKIVSTIFFDQSARSIVELFIHFDSWNNGIKKFTILNPVEKGVYRVETEFFRKGCFSKQKHCQSLISLYKVPDGYFANMKALNHIPDSIKYENWINFNLSVSIKENLKNFAQKKMVISIESSQSSKALVEFAKDMKDFKNYLKTSVQLPSKLLEVKSTISN